ncbi:zinc-dependent metalloprotease [Niabella insulamsoli]|uniref:zinc-dependent metalloprotease n=1 Tax=Niabella insulamsoli TaxID=3144874 RepID=UPI0031FDBC40
MMQRNLTLAFLFLLGLQMSSCALQKKNKKSTPAASAAKTDTTKKAVVGPPGQPKPYKEVITSKAVTEKGMFDVHKIDNKYYFEIPDTLFERDILVVARLSKAAAGFRTGASYAGDQINSNTIRFEKGPNNRVYLKRMSFQELGRDSTEGMYRNVMNSNIQPIGASFEVKAWSPDKKGAVIEVTDYINGDNDYFFFSPVVKKVLGLGGLQADKSYIQAAKPYPANLEIKTVKTYTQTPVSRPGTPPNPYAVSTPVTFELNTSLVLLPKVPMQPRFFDDRVGYFTTQSITDFDVNPQGIDKYRYIARYRLEPKEADIEKYKRGELVEPKKQIVYYIDPTTPKKWVPYLIQGVNDWQVAFEKAGFKNAIVGKMAPTYAEDSTFSLEDARHSAIVYKPSDIPNASGPNVHDPRSGEIMESHINWYHNVMSLVRNWYMIQTAAVDPRARKMEFDDELMGQLIRFVSSHEVGHTLGLRHNFGSSSTVPVEKLRDKAWVEAHGHTPSIMDYARFNYVAQPEDHIAEKGLFPRIGDYDTWAIEWGYRWYPQAKSADDEVALLNKITIEQLKNPRLWWGDGESNREDPRSQTEDLSNNAMKASSYGIKNLQRIVVNLPEYTKQSNKDYTNLNTIYNEVVSQFVRYTGHVARNIGGIERTPKRIEQTGAVYAFTPKSTQVDAMNWLKNNVFSTPFWLVKNDYATLTGQEPLSVVAKVQDRALGELINPGTLSRLIRFQAASGGSAYTPDEMLQTLRRAVFAELPGRKTIDIYRRQLQKATVEKLIALANPSKQEQAALGKDLEINLVNSDIMSVVKGQLRTLASEMRSAAGSYRDAASKNHLLDLQDRIKQALEPK